LDEKESILIVDDDESTCRSLTLVFGKKGYATETAGTGQEAIDKALEEISQNRGILYDSEVVDAFLRLFIEKRFKFESPLGEVATT